MLEQLLQPIPIEAGTTASRLELHSGIARHYPRVYGNLVRKSGGQSHTGVIIVHPMSNFLGHHLLEPFAEADLPIIGLNTRYAGYDAAIILENCLLDIAATIRWARDQLGWKKVVLCGFSGGGPLASMYQSQSEKPTIQATPAGDPPDLTQADLPRADALLLIASSRSRSHMMQSWIDPSLTDERDPDSYDPSLDMYAEDRKPPYDRAWLGEYRKAQLARLARIENWVLEELERLSRRGIRDRAFCMHRTVADPRFLDLSIDPSDREVGSIYGDPRPANEATGPMGRYSSLRSWLSVWSPTYSNGDAQKHLRNVSVPVAIVCLTADQGALPVDSEGLRDSVDPALCTFIEIKGANHYFLHQPDAGPKAVGQVKAWMQSRHLLI